MIRRLRRTGPALLLLAGLALSGCAGVVSRADCQTGDWHRIGEARGLAGRTLDVESIREACAGHGGRVDEGLLRAGYVAGTRQYCQPTAIRQRVFDGERVNPAICPADLAEAAEAAVYEGQGARETWAETWDTRGRLRLLAIYWGAGSAAEQLLDEYLAGRLASQCRDRFRQVASMMAWPADRRPGWRTACGLGSVPFAAVEEADPRLEQALERLPGRKVIFTNGTTRHAGRVTQHIGIEHHFDAVFDIVDSDYEPKPAPAPYEKMVKAFRIDPRTAVMVEDIARNLEPAAAMGMTTVWVPGNKPWSGDGHREPFVHHVVEDLAEWLFALAGER